MHNRCRTIPCQAVPSSRVAADAAAEMPCTVAEMPCIAARPAPSSIVRSTGRRLRWRYSCCRTLLTVAGSHHSLALPPRGVPTGIGRCRYLGAAIATAVSVHAGRRAENHDSEQDRQNRAEKSYPKRHQRIRERRWER
jgi:hypothetical protein